MQPSQDNRRFQAYLHLSIQPYDLDELGIVGSITHMRWLNALHEQLWHQLGLDALKLNEQRPVMTKTQLSSRAPIRRNDRPVGHIRVQSSDGPEWTIAVEIIVNERVVLTAEQTGIFLDRATLRPAALPNALTEALLTARNHRI